MLASTYQYHPRTLLYRTDWQGGRLDGAVRRLRCLLDDRQTAGLEVLLKREDGDGGAVSNVAGAAEHGCANG